MKKMTKRQRIDASREARLWISTIIAPVVGAVTTVALTHPETVSKLKDAVRDKYYSTKHEIKQRYEIWKIERESKKEQ